MVFLCTPKQPTCFYSGSWLPRTHFQKNPGYRQLYVADGSQLPSTPFQKNPRYRQLKVAEGSQLPTTPSLYFLINLQALVTTGRYLPITVSTKEMRLNQRENFKLQLIKNFLKYVQQWVKQQKVIYLGTFSNFKKPGSQRQLEVASYPVHTFLILNVFGSWRQLEVATWEVPVHIFQELDDFCSCRQLQVATRQLPKQPNVHKKTP